LSAQGPPGAGERENGDPIFSIGAVSRMLDVPTSTLRGWEKRYGLVAPGRSKGAHRLYSSSDVEQLRFIKMRLESGDSSADAHRLLAQRRARGLGTRQRVDEIPEPVAAARTGTVRLGVNDAPLHAHYPTFYASDEGRTRLAAPFLRDGLRQGQACFLSATGKIQDVYLDALANQGIDVEHAIQKGQLVVVDAIGTTVDDCIGYWERSFWKVLDAGTSVIRVVGDMVSEIELFDSTAEMMRYETAYNGVAKRFPAVTLCQYDVRVFDGEVVYEAFKAHPDVYDQRVGTFLS
jgi:DNA-binding transcriptional MerR regulator